MVKNRRIFCALLGLLFTQTACSNGVRVDYEEEFVISETAQLENVRVLELDTNDEDNQKVLNVFRGD
ncbi:MULTISPECIES: hypothetical protein [unclassified Lysinibacillus]|nr:MULTISPECIES: hypothetical protein [unclassified Lysinibacillus]